MVYLLISSEGKDFSDVLKTASLDFIPIGDLQWLIFIPGSSTTKEVWEEVLGKPKTRAILFSIHGYFGLAPSSIWEWIVAKRTNNADL